MKLPRDKRERDALYRNLIRYCDVSREDRRARNLRMRSLLLTGTPNGTRARYNKIQEAVQFSTSYLYAPEQVRWGVVYPPHYGDRWEEEADLLRQELHRLWYDSDAPAEALKMVTWAHAYDTVVAKVVVSDAMPDVVMVDDPADIGVLDEGISSWKDDEAICHWYTLDLSRFRRRVLMSTPPNDDYAKNVRRYMDLAEQYSVPGEQVRGADVLPPAVQGVILAAASPQMVGFVNQPADVVALAFPRSREPVVQLAELWVKDDDEGDYRCVTNFVTTEDILWEPLNPLIPGRHPFFGLCIGMLTPGYRWGVSVMEHIIRLQEWHETKIAELDLRDELQLDPPKVFKNISYVDGERVKVLRSPGGHMAFAQPNSEVEMFPPQQLADPFGWLDRIDTMFRNSLGMPRGLTGQGETGEKMQEQIAKALLGAGPTLNRAMMVEDWLEDIATAKLRLHRRLNDRPLTKQDGQQVLMAQMPGDFTARVWAHSASPLYQQQIINKANLAKQAGAIDNEDYLLLLDLPMADVRLISKARKLAQAQSEKQERAIEIKEQEAKAKVLKAQK